MVRLWTICVLKQRYLPLVRYRLGEILEADHRIRRWAFWINLPLAGVAIGVAWFLLPLKPVEGNIRDKLLKIDYVGSSLTILSSVLLLVRLLYLILLK